MGITIFENPYRTPCQNYVCQNISSWFVGVKGGPLNTAFTLCDPCARHMVEHLPVGLLPDGPQKDEKIKKEEIKAAALVEKETLDKKHQQEKEAVLKAVKEELEEQLKAVAAIVEEPLEEKPVGPTIAEELEAKTTYRCLECGAEFTDKRGLSNHMRGKHKEE